MANMDNRKCFIVQKTRKILTVVPCRAHLASALLRLPALREALRENESEDM